MKKKFKGALSLLLCMIMVFGAVAVGGDGIELPSIKGLFGSEAQAASEKYDIYTYEVGSDGTVTITDCDESAQGTITIPSQIDGKPVTSIGYMAFRFCDSLTSITIPNSVTSTFRGFDGCEKLTQINVDTANTVYSSVNGVLFSKDKTELIKYPEGKADTSYAIPNGVTSIGYGAFYDCYSLTSITIPDSVTSIGTMAFEDCSSLTSITIPDSVTSIDRHAFFVCRKLNQINVDTANTAYSSVNGVLFNKGKTELIRYPEGKADTSYAIPNGVTSIGNSAFYGCSNLTSITIPDGVTIIDINAFQYCRSLTSITIPDSVTYISAEAFDGCDSLKAAYYLGFSEQWAEVSIEWGNYRLTNHIVFKSNPEISDVASPTGTSVSMVGKHFYANIGKSGLSLSPGGKATGNQATCYVPVSSQDLDFTFESGNKNILVIGDTEVTFYGVYFIKFNVFGISEGTTTVTVRTSDGASSTAIVTVSETPTSDKILKGEGKLPANAKILVGTMDDYVTAVVLNSKKTYVSDVIIDQKTYPIQKNILPDATIEMFKGKPVIAVMQDGKITEIDLIENYITASVSTNFIDGTAIKDGDTHLVTASVSNTLPSRLMGADLSSLSDKFKIKINSVSIKIGSESVYSGNPYAEIGVDGFKIVASKEVKIKKSFANFNGEADIKVVVTGERNGTPLSFETKSSIKILSKSEWNKISESANKKKTEKQYDNEIKATVAKNSKNLKLDETIAWNATLGEFMSKKQLSALGYAMVGTIVMAEAPKATFTEYLTGKMLDKLGVAHKIAAGAFSVDVPMTVKIKTYKYGELVIDFEAHATNYTLGGKSYGSFGDVTYEITGGSGLSKVPTSMRSGLAGAIAYADVNTFADAMYDIALAEVKKAYNLGYGNDFNTVCDVFFNDTIVDVMLSACKTDYKGAFFDIISYPARQYKGACPIEMRVYDPSNELCGFVSDSKAVSTDENVECTVEGHTKIITVYGYKANDYKVEITATGSGVMNLEASDYAGSCRKLGSQTFTDFPIECGKTYSYICGAVSLDESSKDMITDGSNKVYADDITIFERADIEATKDKYTIVFWSADGSKIIGLYELLPGESIPSIEAPKKVGYDFVGWANENGKIEEIPSTMPASERSFTAVFEPIKTKISINTPSVTTVSYGFTLKLHANVTDLPEGARIVWSMDGSGFELIPSADGMTCGVKSVSKGSATIAAKVVDKSGNAVKDANGNEITASQQLTSKAGFFQKLVAFFKKLFGSNMVIPSSLNKLIK
jgi:GH24 family phage-related lysozyme (muramidase)